MGYERVLLSGARPEYFENKLHLALDDLFELDDVCCESPNTLSKLFCRHGIFIEHPSERFLAHVDLWDIHINGLGSIKLCGDLVIRSGKFVQESWGDS